MKMFKPSLHPELLYIQIRYRQTLLYKVIMNFDMAYVSSDNTFVKSLRTFNFITPKIAMLGGRRLCSPTVNPFIKGKQVVIGC